MTNYERKIDEIVEGAKKIGDESFPVYLDLLVQRGLLVKKGKSAYSATDAFRQMLYKHFVEALRELIQSSEKSLKMRQRLLTKNSPAENFLLGVSLRLTLELITGKTPPVHEDELEYVSGKEIGALARTIYSYIIACKKDEINEMNEELKELLREAGEW